MITLILLALIIGIVFAMLVIGWPVLFILGLIILLIMLDRFTFHLIFKKKK